MTTKLEPFNYQHLISKLPFQKCSVLSLRFSPSLVSWIGGSLFASLRVCIIPCIVIVLLVDAVITIITITITITITSIII